VRTPHGSRSQEDIVTRRLTGREHGAPTPPHPGMACCDPTQDLAAWIRTHRAHVAIQHRWGRACRTKAERFRRLATRALTAGDTARYAHLDDGARALAWIANEWHERANLLADRVDGIAAAHTWRLPADLIPAPPKPPRTAPPPRMRRHLAAQLRPTPRGTR
jgi:hypothetical protein